MATELDKAIIAARERWAGATPADAPPGDPVYATTTTSDAAKAREMANDSPPANGKDVPATPDGYSDGYKSGYEHGRADGFRDALEMLDYVNRAGFIVSKKG